MERRDLLLTHGDGELRAVVGSVHSDLRHQAGDYEVLLDTGELLLLRKVDQGEPHAHSRVLMAGQLVSSSTVLEVVNIIASSRWAGTLEIHGVSETPPPGDTTSLTARRTLGFLQGVLRHASSNHPEDRLDKVLSRTGALNPSQIEAVVREIRPEQRFGELLVEHGLVKRQELFTHLGTQMEQILLAAVLEDRGAYVFSINEDSADTDAHRAAPPAIAHIPLQRLLLSAAERLDRVAAVRKLIPSLAGCPEALPGVDVTRLDPKERLVVGYSTGKRSLRQIASESWLGTFETLETAYRLLRRGQIRIHPPALSPQELAARIVMSFNQCLREVYRTVERYGDPERVRSELDGWIGQDPDHGILGGPLDNDGLIDTGAVARVLAQSSSSHQVRALEDALHGLASFALFSASLSLPRSEEARLTQRVNRQLKASRNGSG